MKNEDFLRLIKNKSKVALLKLARSTQSGVELVNPHFLFLIVKELETRNLTAAENKELLQILNKEKELDELEEERKQEGEFVKSELALIINEHGIQKREKRNASLRSIAWQISRYGDLLLVIGVGLLFYATYIIKMPKGYGFYYGLMLLFGAYVSRLFIVAFAKLILVWMEIEINTRKESGAGEKG